MSSNNNFLLKLHMEEDNNLTEIYLNKERRSFTFLNDECVSDLVIPEFKIASLKMILKNKNEDTGSETYYAEYEENDELVREYDKDKIELLKEMVTKISISDFMEYRNLIKLNDYYIDNVVDAYNCVLPMEMKKILSYTTNGVVFSGAEKIYLMAHDEIIDYDKKIKNFIPVMIKNDDTYIGYDYKDSIYKEYRNQEMIRESERIKDLATSIEDIELLDVFKKKEEPIVEETKEEPVLAPPVSEEKEEKAEDNFEIIGDDVIEDNFEIIEHEELAEEVIDNTEDSKDDVMVLVEEREETETLEPEVVEETIEETPMTLEEEMAAVDEEYENTIKNIDLQFEKLSSGLVQPEKKEEYQFIEKKKTDEQEIIKQEIRDEVKKSLDEIDETNEIIDEIDTTIERVISKAKNIKAHKKELPDIKTKEIVKTPKVKERNKTIKTESKENELFLEFLKEYDKKHTKEKLDSKFQTFINEYDEKHRKNKEKEKFQAFINEYDKKHGKDKLDKQFRLFLENYESKLKKTKEKEEFQTFINEYDKKHRIEKTNKQFKEFLDDYDNKLKKNKEEETFRLFINEYDRKHKQNKLNTEFQVFLGKYENKLRKTKENEKFQAFINEYDKKHGKNKLNKQFEEFIASYEIKHAKAKADKKFYDFLQEQDKKHGKEKENKKFREFLVQYEVKYNKEKEEQLFREFLTAYENKKLKEKEEAMFQEFIQAYETKVKKEKEQIKFMNFLTSYENKLKKNKENEQFRAFLVEYENKLNKEREQEAFVEFLKTEDQKHRDAMNEKILNNKKKQEEKEEALTLNQLIYFTVQNSLDNFKINFNDTQKLVVEHLPYYEFTNSFDVIQIPEIEIDKITLVPDGEVDLGKVKFSVDKLTKDKVELVVKSASSIIDKDNTRLKKGSIITLDLKNEIALRLDKKNAMETWSLHMEKSTFEKELRNVDYGKVMNEITKLDSYKKLGNIEKLELEKSIMLFIHLVMVHDEEKQLKELYRILDEEPTLYEEFVTKYNIGHSLELQDSLATYEEKKEFVTKLNYVNGLIDAKWLDYPRYIFASHNYFSNDTLLEDFNDELNEALKETDFATYMKKLFKEYDMFKDLDELGQINLDKCLEYLSLLYKYNPDIGEDNKYRIEKTFMIGATEEDISILISKLCRKGIKDYSVFVEYDAMVKEKYRLGELKYPIYSESFGLEEIRNGGEYDEY